MCAAVIIAGGESKRFGSPKALIRINGVPIILKLAAEAANTGIEDIRISANDPDAFAPFGLPVIADIREGCGPLAGIHSALVQIDTDEILLIPCDTPGISAQELNRLLMSAKDNPTAQVVFAESTSGMHPLCAVVRRTILRHIESALDEGRLSVNELFTGVDHVKVIFENEEPFLNLNTPEDLARWEVHHDAP